MGLKEGGTGTGKCGGQENCGYDILKTKQQKQKQINKVAEYLCD